MDACRLGLAVIAILTLLIALKPEPGWRRRGLRGRAAFRRRPRQPR